MNESYITIAGRIIIPKSELQFEPIRASGPGGQNVNKVASAIQLRFNIRQTQTLSRDIKERAIRLAGRRVSSDGTLVIDARQHRSQKRNQQDAIQRFIELIAKAEKKPVYRVKTKPSRNSIKRRLESKKHRSGLKKQRQSGKNSHSDD
jgi:ribosome-associated protein